MTLDKAWAEAEAALPEGMVLRLEWDPTVTDVPAEASAIEATPSGWESSVSVASATPAAALQALAAKLRERQR